MNIDFSHLNQEYLIHAHDLARQDSQLTASLLYMPDESARALAATKASKLTQLRRIKVPLLVPRSENWWWKRLFQAVQDGSEAEIRAIVDHAGLFVIPAANGGANNGRA